MSNEINNKPKIPRPFFNDELVKKLAVICAAMLHKKNDSTDMEDCIKDSEQVLKYNFNSGGYELAKEFEHLRYSINMTLIEELDTVHLAAQDLLEDEVENWVKKNQITLDLKIGDQVIFNSYRKNNEHGEIMKLYPDTAQYGIWSESTGYEKGKGVWVINFETIKELVKELN